MTKDEIVALIRSENSDALQAVLLGGDHGDWTQKKHPLLVKPKANGVLDRLHALETKK